MGNSTQYSVMTYMGKESKKKVDICIYARDFPAVSDGKECRRPRFDPWIGNIS